MLYFPSTKIAFLAGRNLVLLTMGAAYAYQNGANAVSIGFLKKDTAIFNDQTDEFLEKAQDTISFAMGFDVKILTPLRDFYKKDIVELAKQKKIYDTYSFHLLPKMGELVANDAESYRYLAESIRMHPDQETLKGMMNEAGFDQTSYYNLTGGIVALHRGYKF